MKKIILLICIVSCCQLAVAQRFGWAKSCNVNVNDPSHWSPAKDIIISSTVKLSLGGFCSGTLVNRNTSDGSLGFYILTAKHCIDGLNFGANQTLYFNYQSPDASNSSTALSNRGVVAGQSTSLSSNGHQYAHVTKLRKVQDFTWGDLALLEVLTPIPPHFNLTYSGWTPSRFYNGPLTGLPNQYTGVHHPRGDIKKMSGAVQVVWLENPIATGCYTVTKVIDVLFGWIWKRKWSTSVICNYIDNPWVTVPLFHYGTIEGGSSGSGLFNSNWRNFGVLSGSTAGCTVPGVTTYGKLHANYSNAAIKNTLNPNNNVAVDLFGLTSRKISCYSKLVLPGATGVSGHYFPAEDYQGSNKITLRSASTIITTQDITVYNEADYDFIANQSVLLSAGFEAQSGSNFQAKIGNCSSSIRRSPEDEVLDRIRDVYLPDYMAFERSNYELGADEPLTVDDFKLKVFPNPTSGKVQVSIALNKERNAMTAFDVELVGLDGKICFKDQVEFSQQYSLELDINEQPSGFYLLRISNDQVLFLERIVKN